MLKKTGSSVASAFRVDDDEVVCGGDVARVESGRSVCQRVHQTIQVTCRRSKTSWERFDSSRRLLLADASMGFHLQQCRYTVYVKGLTRLQTIKRVKLLNDGPRDDLWLGLGGQECPRYDEYLDYTNILTSTIMLLS